VPGTFVETTLADAGQAYLASLQPGPRQEQSPDVQRFVRWFGAARRLADLRGADIEQYAAEQATTADAEQRLTTVRAFLTYLKRAGLTDVNLGVHVRVRRAGSSLSGDSGGEEKIEVTADGLAALQAELEALRAQRPRIAEALRAAMSDKDFRENAPLDATREQQAHVEARIRELEALLKRAVVVESGTTGPAARLGSRVRLRDLQSGREVHYVLVGPGEVNAAEGRISVASPVGRALVGHLPGDEVEVVAPARTFRYRIEAIEG
jgi:transcription elongation factor GreA